MLFQVWKGLGGPRFEVWIISVPSVLLKERYSLFVSLDLHLIVVAIKVLTRLAFQLVQLLLMLSIQRVRKRYLEFSALEQALQLFRRLLMV